MTDPRTEQSIEWLHWYSRQYGPAQKDPTVLPRLSRVIADSLEWKIGQLHQRQLSAAPAAVLNHNFSICLKSSDRHVQ